MVPKSYKKHIAEGKGVLILSFILAFALRISYFVLCDYKPEPSLDGYLWTPIAAFFQHQFYSLLASSIVVLGIAFFATNINNTYTFIRKKTLLVPALSVLLFSCHPSFNQMSASYISVLIVLFTISILFGAYSRADKQQSAMRASFVLAFGSLYVPSLLLYLPILWVSLYLVRSFNFKAFLASLFGVALVYIPAVSYFILTDNLTTFCEPFVATSYLDLNSFPFMRFDFIDWFILGVSALCLLITFISNYTTSYKDKIRIRAYLQMLSLVLLCALLFYLFLNICPQVHLYVALLVAAFLLSHLFALTESRVFAVLFYVLLLMYLIISILPILEIY